MANHELVLGHGQDAELALGQNHHDFGQDHGLGLGHGHELDLGGHHHDHDLVLGQSHEHDHDLVLGQSHDHDLGLGHHDDDHQLVLGHDHHHHHHHGGELALRQGHEEDSGALDVHGHHHDELELSDSHELTLAEAHHLGVDESHHLGVDESLDDQLSLEQAHELALHPHDLSQAPLAVAPVVQSRTMVVSPEFQLAVGQEFPDVMSCRRAIRNTAIACHFEIQTVKSDKVHC
ncbi:unnamed protein product [Urochloa humidicola]